MPANWLAALAEHSLGNFEVTYTIDQDLSRRAILARRDAVERDQLFALLAAKIDRFARRFQYWKLDPWEYDDVLQLTFPTFVDTIRRWTPRIVDAQPAGYLYYYLRVYPLWLSSEVRRLTGRNRPLVLPFPAQHDVPTEPTAYSAGPETAAIIDDICERLTHDEARILRLRVATGQSVPRVAAEIGLTRRTAYRRWHNIATISRRYLEEVG